MSSKIGKRQQKRSRFDVSGVVVTGAFKRLVRDLTDSCSGVSQEKEGDEKDDDGSSPRRIDAAFHFKSLFQTFTTLSSTSNELICLGEILEVLEVMAAGGTSVSSAQTIDKNEFEKTKKKVLSRQTKPQTGGVFEDGSTAQPSSSFRPCVAVLFGVLFLPNSRPLHRQIVASPRRFPPAAKRLAEQILGNEIQGKIRAALDSETSSSVAGDQKKTPAGIEPPRASGASSLRVLGVLFSVVACQPQTECEKRIVEKVALDAAALIGKGVQSMLDQTNAGRRVPPAEMETCQEAMSVAYALVVRHPGLFFGGEEFAAGELTREVDAGELIGQVDAGTGTGPVGSTLTGLSSAEVTDVTETDNNSNNPSEPKPHAAITSLVLALCRTLQGNELSREAGVSAGVTIAVVVGAGIVCPKRRAASLADAFFSDCFSGDVSGETWTEVNETRASCVDAVLSSSRLQSEQRTTIKNERAKFTPFGKISAVRGVLTAASGDALSQFLVRPGTESKSKNPDWLVLTHGCVPLLCDSLENPVDSHHKFHAAAALKSALTRIKALVTSAGSGVNHSSKDASHKTRTGHDTLTVDVLFPKELSHRVSAILWANWEDPLSQTVKETHLSFECLLDIEDQRGDGGGTAFLTQAADLLLKKPLESKGRYVPLAFVCRRLGATALIKLDPHILHKTIRAMRDDSVCTAAGTLVGALSLSFMAELGGVHGRVERSGVDNSSGSAKGEGDNTPDTSPTNPPTLSKRVGKNEVVVDCGLPVTCVREWRAWWIPPLVEALTSTGRQRVGASVYAAPSLLKQDGASVVPLLRAIVESSVVVVGEDDTGKQPAGKKNTTHARAASAIVAVLKSARTLGLLDSQNVNAVNKKTTLAAWRTFTSSVNGVDSNDGFGKQSGDANDVSTTCTYQINPDWLRTAATSADPNSRCDVLELLCLDGKRASLPGTLELELLTKQIVVNIRDANPAFRNALVSNVVKLLGRVKVGLQKTAVIVRARPWLVWSTDIQETLGTEMDSTDTTTGKQSDESTGKNKSDEPPAAKKQSIDTRGALCFGAHAKGVRAVDDADALVMIAMAKNCVDWLTWFVKTLVASSYPGAPYTRKQTALDLLHAVAVSWSLGDGSGGGEDYSSAGVVRTSGGNPRTTNTTETTSDGNPLTTETTTETTGDVGSKTTGLAPERSPGTPPPPSPPPPHIKLALAFESSPYELCLGADVVQSLLGAVVDSWDKLRVQAFNLLTKHETPLAGLETRDQVESHLRWALSLSRSPRVRESDAAALLLRLLFRKYALDGGWAITLVPTVTASPPSEAEVKKGLRATRGLRSAKLLGTMCDLIEWECQKAELDLFAACTQSLAHGALLATRYALAEIDFETMTTTAAQKSVTKSLSRLLELLERVTSVALTSISAPDGANIGATANDITLDKLGGGSGQGAAAAKAAAHAISGVGGTTAGDDSEDETRLGDDENTPPTPSLAPKAQMIVTACWLTMKEVSLVIGEVARRVPTPGGDGARGIANAAVDEGDGDFRESSYPEQESSDSLSAGLLHPSQLKLAGDRLLSTLLTLKHNGAIEKTLVGLTCLGERVLRSGNSELSELPKLWLKTLFQRLTQSDQSIQDLIRRSAGIPFGFMAVFLAEPRGTPRTLLYGAMDELLRIASDDGDSVRRGERALGQSQGVHVPQVHAFNVLRFAFADKELATDTASFAARGLRCAIRAFSSPHWEVRNGATLTFASLVTKVVGYMNVATPSAGGASRRAVAGDEFFKRFPSMHSFLLGTLTEASEAFEGTSNGFEGVKNGQSKMHPALYPILSLLARLRPSCGAPVGDGSGEGDAEPFETVSEVDPGVSAVDPETSVQSPQQSSLDPALFIPVVRRCARGRVHAVRAQAARALSPLVRPRETPAALRATFVDTDFYQNETTAKRSPINGYNAAHGALLCATELLGVDGPVCAAGVDFTVRANAVIAASEGLATCSYLVDPADTPVAALAAAWAACSINTLAVARAVRARYLDELDESSTEELQKASTRDESIPRDESTPQEDAKTLRVAFFTAARRLTRLAAAACDASGSGFGFVRFSGGGGSSNAKDASSAGSSVSVGDVEWFKRSARLRCEIALDATGFSFGTQEEEEDVFENDDDSKTTDDDVLVPSKTAARRFVSLKGLVACVDPSLPYELRASGLKSLRDAETFTVLHALGENGFCVLFTFLSREVLPNEKIHACTRRCLQVLERWSDVFFTQTGAPVGSEPAGLVTSCDDSWRLLVTLASADRNERVRCAGIACLGKFARFRFAKDFENLESDSKLNPIQGILHEKSLAEASSLVALVRAGCSPTRPLEVRRAVAKALAHSKILERLPRTTTGDDNVKTSDDGGVKTSETPGIKTSEDYGIDDTYHQDQGLGDVLLIAWQCAFELMEDEDEPTREVVSRAASVAVGVDSNAQTEQRLRCVFFEVAKRMKRWPAWTKALHVYITGGFWEEDDTDEVGDTSKDSGAGKNDSSETDTVSSSMTETLLASIGETKVVRRLFDREADNHHGEGLLLAQLSAQVIRSVPNVVDKAYAAKRLANAARAVVACADVLATGSPEEKDGAKDSDEKDDDGTQSPDWAGGPSNHPSGFGPTNRALLALWAYGASAGADARREAKSILKFGCVSKNFEIGKLGPAAAAAWRAAEKSLEETLHDDRVGKQSGAETKTTRSAFHEFDPCFLLR